MIFRIILSSILAWSTSLTAQTILYEVQSKSLLSSFEVGISHRIGFTFDIGDRWFVGPTFFTQNDVYREPYLFFYGNTINLDPIHTAYRVQDGNVLFESDKFQRGIKADQLADFTFPSNNYQDMEIGLIIGFSYVKTKRWNAYIRVIPGFVRYRWEFVQTLLDGALVRMEGEKEFVEVLYSEKQVYFRNRFGFRPSLGVLYKVIPRLNLGVDFFSSSSDNWKPRIGLSLTYNLKENISKS